MAGAFDFAVCQRAFQCPNCPIKLSVCASCERGQIYCRDCSELVRRKNVRQAGAIYQATRKGAIKHAARQSAYVAKQIKIVTHHALEKLDLEMALDQPLSAAASTKSWPPPLTPWFWRFPMNMSPCSAQMRLTRQYLHLTVQQLTGEPVLRARLPLQPMHPRAILELLESIASCTGHPLDAALSVAVNSLDSFDQAGWCSEICWGPSASVRVAFCSPASRKLRLGAVSRRSGRIS